MDESAKSLLIGVAASILSAIVVLVLQYIGQRILDRLKFASMEGEYYEISLPANEETGGAIKLKRRRNAFESEARNRENHIVWNGLIVMDKTIPYLGRGVYQYRGKHDSGIHEIQRSTETGHIMVWGSNTSHPSGVQRFNILWKRKA